MFRQAFIENYFSVLHSDGPQPLKIWKPNCTSGWIKRVWDNDISAFAVEIRSPNVSTCWMKTKYELGLSLPYVSMGLRSFNQFFTFEITIRDDSGIRRRIRFGNFETKSRCSVFSTSIPLFLQEDWSFINIDLPRLTHQAFGVKYIETVSIAIHANCRVRNIFFSRELGPVDELPKKLSLNPKKRTKTERRKPKIPMKLDTIVPPPSECDEDPSWNERLEEGGSSYTSSFVAVEEITSDAGELL